MIDLAAASAQCAALLDQYEAGSWSYCLTVQVWTHRRGQGPEARVVEFHASTVSGDHRCFMGAGDTPERAIRDLAHRLEQHLRPPAAVDDLRVEIPAPEPAPAA